MSIIDNNEETLAMEILLNDKYLYSNEMDENIAKINSEENFEKLLREAANIMVQLRALNKIRNQVILCEFFINEEINYNVRRSSIINMDNSAIPLLIQVAIGLPHGKDWCATTHMQDIISSKILKIGTKDDWLTFIKALAETGHNWGEARLILSNLDNEDLENYVEFCEEKGCTQCTDLVREQIKRNRKALIQFDQDDVLNFSPTPTEIKIVDGTMKCDFYTSGSLVEDSDYSLIIEYEHYTGNKEERSKILFELMRTNGKGSFSFYHQTDDKSGSTSPLAEYYVKGGTITELVDPSNGFINKKVPLNSNRLEDVVLTVMNFNSVKGFIEMAKNILTKNGKDITILNFSNFSNFNQSKDDAFELIKKKYPTI